jgi:hypothetical protein
VDLWLLQAQLREKTPSEYVQALRCYMSALDLIEQQLGSRRKAPAAVLSNISVLHQSLNKLDKVGLCLPLMVFFVFGEPVAWFLFALCVGSRIQHSEFAVRLRYSACPGRRPEQSAHTVFVL